MKKNGFHACGALLAALFVIFMLGSGQAEAEARNFFHGHDADSSTADYFRGNRPSDITPYFRGNDGDIVNYYSGIIHSGPISYFHGNKGAGQTGYFHGNAGTRVFFHGAGRRLTH